MRGALVIVFLAGCASASTSDDTTYKSNMKGTLAPGETLDLTRENLVKHVQFNAPRDRVWMELLAAHHALGVPLTSSDARAGVAVFELTNRLRSVAGKPASKYIDCGSGTTGPRTDTYRLTIKLTHKLHTVLETTTLTTTLLAWARNPGVSGDPLPCTSLGRLETEIAGVIAARLQR